MCLRRETTRVLELLDLSAYLLQLRKEIKPFVISVVRATWMESTLAIVIKYMSPSCTWIMCTLRIFHLTVR